MKPHASPITCSTYFVTEMNLSANADYDAKKDPDLDLDDLKVESRFLDAALMDALQRENPPPPETEMTGERLIALSVEQDLPAEKNPPYNFSIHLVGFFEIIDGLPAERAEQLLLTNGSSILYAAAREILRDMTSKGPHPPVLLPTLSFFPLPKAQVPSEAGKPAA